MSLIIGKQAVLGLNYIYMGLLRHIYKKTEVIGFQVGLDFQIEFLCFSSEDKVEETDKEGPKCIQSAQPSCFNPPQSLCSLVLQISELCVSLQSFSAG